MFFLVSTAISVIALIGTLIGVWYTRKQVVFIRSEKETRERDEKETAEWSARATGVVLKLLALMPRSTANGPIYRRIVEDGELSALIETYLVHWDIGRNKVEARTLGPDMLRMPVVRNTIERVEKQFDRVKEENPDLAAKALL